MFASGRPDIGGRQKDRSYETELTEHSTRAALTVLESGDDAGDEIPRFRGRVVLIAGKILAQQTLIRVPFDLEHEGGVEGVVDGEPEVVADAGVDGMSF